MPMQLTLRVHFWLCFIILCIGLAIEPVTQPRPGEEMAIKSVILSAERK
jgi:hypothetical protein